MLIPGVNPKVEVINWNKRMAELPDGELEEEMAREVLGGFLMQNIGLTAYQLTGYILEPDQRVVIRGWMQKNFSLCVAGRGYSKSWLLSHFNYLYALTHREQHILVVSATFRSSRRVVEEIDRMAHRKRTTVGDKVYPGGELLLETFEGKMEKKPDLYRIRFKNGSTITAVPLGDPDNLRGFRCNVLEIDERLLISEATIESVLKPFLTGETNLTQKQRIQQKENEKIEAGLMKEEDRRRFPSSSKMIALSSASYKWEELYETYQKYLKIINPDSEDPNAPKREETDGNIPSYIVQQLSYKIAEKRMNKALLKEIEDKIIPENIIHREYEARFIDESGGYFSAKEMKECTVPNGQLPSVELTGEKGAEYILGIDPNVAGGETTDHFAMCVIKIITRERDGRKMALVVHQYGCSGVELKHHMAYLYYILAKFNPVYIVCDTTQGDNADFISICNESEYFKARRLELNAVDANFTSESFEEIVKQVKKSYNKDSAVRRIVQKQFFTSPIIKAGNEYLRAALDQRIIWFPSHAQSVANLVPRLCGIDVLDIHKTHPEYLDERQDGGGNMYEFVTYQDNMIERVKKECALIEVTASPIGNLTFDLPHSMTRNRKNVNRQRKDNYSALWLANWGFKIYTAMMEMPEAKPDEGLFTPRWLN